MEHENPYSRMNSFFVEQLQRNFLWGRSEDVFKHSLVNWKGVCLPTQAGGVGIRQLKLHNEALMGKWLWRFSHEDSSLWKRMIVTKYGVDKGGWISTESCSRFGVTLWHRIRRMWPKFICCASWDVGRGNGVLFWRHPWLNIGCLSDVFPDIYAIAVEKEAFISDYYSGSGIYRVWTIHMRRNLNDWEWDSYLSLMDLLYSLSLADTEDILTWRLPNFDVFSVKSYYQHLQGAEEDSFEWEMIWKAKVPTRVSFFTWCAVKGRILTMDNLKRRGYHLVNRCPLCLLNEESINHLLIHCKWSAELWHLVLSCFGVQTCFPDSLQNFLTAWWSQPMNKLKKKFWNLIPQCIFWLLWKERNRRLFDNGGRNLLISKSLFISCLFSWVKEGKELDLSSLLLFLDSMK